MTPTERLSAAIEAAYPGAEMVARGGVIERWDGPMAQPSQAEVDAALAAYVAPSVIDGRVFWRRFTQDEHRKIRAVSKANEDLADMIDELRMGYTVDVRDARVVAGVQSLKPVMIPSVWATTTIANRRIAEILL